MDDQGPKIVTISMPLPVAQQFIQVLEGALQSYYQAVEAAGVAGGPPQLEGAPADAPMSPEDQKMMDVLANS